MWLNTSMNQFSFKFSVHFFSTYYSRVTEDYFLLHLISQISFYESALKLKFFVAHNAGEN